MIGGRRLMTGTMLAGFGLGWLATGVAGTLPDPGLYPETRRRPLFAPDRRPPTPAPAAAPAAEPTEAPPPPIVAPPPDVTLNGIILGGDRSVAIIRAGSSAGRRVSIGSEVEGWTVTAIEPRRIELRLAARRIVVELSPAGR